MDPVQVVAAEALDLFVGSESAPRQVVRVAVRGVASGSGVASLWITGDRLAATKPIMVGPLAPGEEARVEIGVAVDGGASACEVLRAGVTIRAHSDVAGAAPADDDLGGDREPVRYPFDFVVAEPGWRMFMISHFHYDPVWWNTQAAYTETWGKATAYRLPFQDPGLALVRAHLDCARRDPRYKFVLAELDYLKPYWDLYPEDRSYLRQLLAEGRLELVGATYNEPNTNLTSAELTIRNAIYGIGFQREVLGGSPATAWQLDAFGHDPQFPGIMADAGATSSSWARGPFHEWGPNWVRGPGRLPFAERAEGAYPRMQFPTEFDWIAPSGQSLLTCFMANHYSAGWWMDSAVTLEEAEANVHALFSELAPLAATRNVLLPVGTDYSPPNKWLTAIERDWNARYVWPKFLTAIPRDFFNSVRAERAKTGRRFSPQTRDMNPIYTGKDVSFIDTKQAQRIAENTLLSAEKFATLASLYGARFPFEAIDKAWRQLLFGAHHDGITGSESDQVYLDLLGGWREAFELAASMLYESLNYLGQAIETTGDGVPLAVFNSMSWTRTDVVRIRIDLGEEWPAGGVELRDENGAALPFAIESIEQVADGRLTNLVISFIARDVPALGYRTYRVVPASLDIDRSRWSQQPGTEIGNEAYALAVDPRRGGAITTIVHRPSGKELLQEGQIANEVLAYREYPNHPLFGEGPWHLTPDGRVSSSADAPANVVLETSPIGRRLRIDGAGPECRMSQTVTLWNGIDRIDLATSFHDYVGQDRLFRVRFPAAIAGGRSLSEVGNAVIGRAFGRPNVDVAEVPFTLDNPSYNWFGLGSTARIDLVEGTGGAGGVRATEPYSAISISVAEIIAADDERHDDAIRGLVTALVRSGVTSTVTRDVGPRYGELHIDSNLPDIRISLGVSDENAFTAEALATTDPRFTTEIQSQLASRGRAIVLVPATLQSARRDAGIPDHRGASDLPVLVVAGSNSHELLRALEDLTLGLAGASIVVTQPPALPHSVGRVEEFCVGVLNRGLPGFNVEEDGSLYLSLMRSCSGWPSGVWIDPPRRSTPDGSNFQFQHWSHTFEYAIAASPGDWRSGAMVRAGHELNNPLIAQRPSAHSGHLPSSASFVSVDPPSVVLTTLKPAGHPLARLAAPSLDTADLIAFRVYESSGRPTRASITSRFAIEEASSVNLLEEEPRLTAASRGVVTVDLEPFGIETLLAKAVPIVQVDDPVRSNRVLGPVTEPAQPVFAEHWRHNKGAAPMGYQPLAVHIRPSVLAGAGPFTLPITVASDRTDGAIAGTVELVTPAGWNATPSARIFRLAPGAHLSFETSVCPEEGVPSGRYFIAARVADGAGQTFEDVVTLDYEIPLAGSPADAPLVRELGTDHVGDELVAELLAHDVRVVAGERVSVKLVLRNSASSEIRGEAQLLSPHETWPFMRPWTQGFVVGGGAEVGISFAVAPGADTPAGRWWALFKVMYYGRRLYTKSIAIEVTPRASANCEIGHDDATRDPDHEAERETRDRQGTDGT
jgi:alpha-mannosidase